ncbi:hypothetical protein G6L37_07285 [Agrobacterium rubi]|nr:hypothetical protein [Agrobacterium rubi]NTF25170.1 hypothetical protein [Agrobacterium rubi]
MQKALSSHMVGLGDFMDPAKRKIAAAAAGAVLGVPAVIGAIPVLGVAGGFAAAAAVVAGGVAGFMMMVPVTRTDPTPKQILNPDIRISLDALHGICDGIERSEISAALRHSAQSLLVIANDSGANVADLSFVILNMESLLGIAEAWRMTETSTENPFSADALAAFTIGTISDVTRNARQRRETLIARLRNSLEVELAVTRRITEEDRKEQNR